MNKSKVVVRAQNLTKRFDEHMAVDGINFEVFEGECLGILGPNGAGKTTTIRMLLGLTVPSEGEIQVLGYEMPKDASEMRNYVGIVPQDNNLDPDFSVLENLKIHASYFGIKPKVFRERLQSLLDFSALGNRTDAQMSALSGGMKRRLILARALLNDPKLLILDEPTTGLDPQARHLIWQRLRSLRNEDKTIIVTTHYLEEAERLCDRVLVVDHGKILAEGSPVELIKEHIEPFVLEIHGKTDALWFEAQERLPHIRMERAGETLFCYCNEEHTLIEELNHWQDVKFINRPANLEDVFLKLTGRELRDE